jgi:hypothetical protein
MNYRIAFAICFVLLTGSLLVNVPGRFAAAQEAKEADPAEGRFAVAAFGNSSSFSIVVCDTKTGQCSVKHSVDQKTWHDYGSPADRKAK